MAEIEIPVGFAVVLSSVMGNRLCLNVRGMLKQDHDYPSVYIPPHRVANPGQYGSRSANTGDHDDNSFGLYNLTATDLSELRAMRAHKITSV